MDYEYILSQGGTYTVKAFAPKDAASTESNEVEVNAMTWVSKEASVRDGKLRVNIIISDAFAGTFYVCFKEGAQSVEDITSGGAYQKYINTSVGLVSHVFEFDVGFDGPPSAIKLSGEAGSETKLDSDSLTIYAYFIGSDSSVQMVADSFTFFKDKANAFTFIITPYTHELKITAGANMAMGAVSTVHYKTGPEWKEITISNPSATSYDDPTFGNNIVGASSVTFQIREDELATGLKALYTVTDLAKDYVVPVVSLGTPVLTYSASEGKLQWDEVEGAERYEVWKDGVKIADIPKKT